MVLLKRYLLLSFFIFLAYSSTVCSFEIKKFSSDGCTMAADGLPGGKVSWRSCCVEHDLWYWVGGQKQSRLKADKNLKKCIERKSSKIIAEIYYLGVQFGKLSPFKLSGRQWANAWSDRVEYKKLSEEQIFLIKNEIKKNQLPLDVRQKLEVDLEQRLTHL